MEMTTVYKSPMRLKIISARHILNEAGIDTFVLDKQDSAYVGLFGVDILLNVTNSKASQAKVLLKEAGFYDEEE